MESPSTDYRQDATSFESRRESSPQIGTTGPDGSPLVIGKEVRAMFGSIARGYDRTNSILSLGIHKWWRVLLARRWRDIAQNERMSKSPVLDLCTGTGDVLHDLKRSFSKVFGADFCLPMLEQGRARDHTAPFLQADAQLLPFPENIFQLVTVSFGIRNVESLERGLREIYRVLKPGGRVLIMEFGQPKNRLWGACFSLYSNVVLPVVGGMLTGNRAAYEYLPKTSRLFPCREAFAEHLAAVGFSRAEYISLTGGVAYIYSAEKGGSPL